ncbi:hypothetical protein P7K49_033472 [Saguinus oedipus]|uniref:Uncharacterized protein n=1 Tax=Saguinus oedipus TaxID=9490 RepID=A0ABQ9TSR4_SAGOE|nr:hypothetical protein P7K49_033472 [Saguinus oedipus]
MTGQITAALPPQLAELQCEVAALREEQKALSRLVESLSTHIRALTEQQEQLRGQAPPSSRNKPRLHPKLRPLNTWLSNQKGEGTSLTSDFRPHSLTSTGAQSLIQITTFQAMKDTV